MKYYFIGIKGTGMSALACTLKQMGNVVTGSDYNDYFFTQDSLDKNKITYKSFNENNINIKDGIFFIISTAYDKNNIEVNKVIKTKCQYMYYHEFIEFFFKEKKIGISGTHGKTTTTSILNKLMENQKICSICVDSTGIGNIDYKYLILEACEYKDHFLQYNYNYLIINNIEYDHPDYFKSLNHVIDSFQKAANRSEYLIINNDDENCKKINHKNKITYGFNPESDVIIHSLKEYRNGFSFKLVSENHTDLIYLPITGIHNIYNFTSAYCVVKELGLKVEFNNKMVNYKMPKRRMEERIINGNIIINDYAHHPTEIKALLNSIRQKYKMQEIIVIFQPHTYSRTITLKEDFKKVFNDVDELYLCETYTSVRERYDYDKEKETQKIFNYPPLFSKKVMNYLKNVNNKIIVFLGAGVINNYINEL